jgi:hypothetical protein
MISAEEVAVWYQGCDLTEDWTSQNFSVWADILQPLRAQQINVLEIGSWEGRSALFFLNYLSNCRITCVDTFAGGDEHRNNPKWASLLPEVERRFDANVARFKSRVEKIKAASSTALADLGIAKRRYDLIYVDGSHRAADVYADAVLAWSLLNRRGAVIFDDYEWPHATDARDGPKLGIDSFLWNFINQYAVIFRGYQLVVQKV